MRIGIFTFHRAYNCGAMLQAWALKTVLERMGHIVTFPKCNRVGEVPRWQAKIPEGRHGLKWLRGLMGKIVVDLMSIPADGLAQKRYKAFRRKYLPERDFHREAIADDYDLLVYGSDQIWWTWHYTDEEKDVFFLRGFGDGVKKITYAASLDDKPLSGDDAEMLKSAITKFDRVSVREKLAGDLAKLLTGKDYPIVLDPTLLLTADDYEKVECHDFPTGEYLFVYVLFATPFMVQTAHAVAERLGIKLVMTSVYQYSKFKAPKGLVYGCSPDRLVSYVKHAKYVMSYSFHGTVFSLLHGKKFVDLRPGVDKYETRSASLLRQLGINNRIANPETPVEQILEMLKSDLPVDYMSRLETLRSDSIVWLRSAVRDMEVVK